MIETQVSQEEISRKIDAFLETKETLILLDEKTGIQKRYVDATTAVEILSILAKLKFGEDKRYSKDAVHSLKRRGKIKTKRYPTGSVNFYEVESLKVAPIDPSVSGKPVQKTQQKVRPPIGGYEPFIREHANKLFAGIQLNEEDLETLSQQRGSKEIGVTRMRKYMSNRAIAAYLNMTHGIDVHSQTIGEWRREWKQLQKTS